MGKKAQLFNNKKENGYMIVSLKTSNKTDAIKKAKEIWFEYISSKKLINLNFKKVCDKYVTSKIKKVSDYLLFGAGEGN